MMTPETLRWRLIRRNFRQYFLHILCEVFAVMMVLTFACMLDSPSLQPGASADSRIASMIIAPAVGILLFTFGFITYTHRSFVLQRQKVWGVLMSLGMTRNEVSRQLVQESAALTGVSLAVGIILGTPMALLFFILSRSVADTGDLILSLTPRGYALTAGLLAAAGLVSLGISLLDLRLTRIRKMLTATRRRRQPWLSGPVAGFTGVVLTLLAAADIFSAVSGGAEAQWGRSFAMATAGLWLMIRSAPFLWAVLLKPFRCLHLKFWLALKEQQFRQSRGNGVLFCAAVLMLLGALITGLGVSQRADDIRIATGNTPFEVSYVQIGQKNRLPADRGARLMEAAGSPVTRTEELPFLMRPGFVLFPSDRFEAVTGVKLEPTRGNFVQVFCHMTTDGYSYEDKALPQVSLPLGSRERVLKSRQTLTSVPVNPSPVIIGGNLLVLNPGDYEDIREAGAFQSGILCLFRVPEWKASGPAVEALNARLQEENRRSLPFYSADPGVEKRMLQAHTRIGEYTTGQRAWSLMLFLNVTAVGLFLLCSTVMLWFRSLTELPGQASALRKMHRCGMTPAEAVCLLRHMDRFSFLLPPVAGSFSALCLYPAMNARSLQTAKGEPWLLLCCGGMILIMALAGELCHRLVSRQVMRMAGICQ